MIFALSPVRFDICFISGILELQMMKTYAKVRYFHYLWNPWTTDDENICQGLMFSLSPVSLNCDDRNICHKWISRSDLIFDQEVFFIRLDLWSRGFLHQTWSLIRGCSSSDLIFDQGVFFIRLDLWSVGVLHQTWSLIRGCSSSDLIFDHEVFFIRLDLWSWGFLHQTWYFIRGCYSSDLIFDQGVFFIRLDLWSGRECS